MSKCSTELQELIKLNSKLFNCLMELLEVDSDFNLDFIMEELEIK